MDAKLEQFILRHRQWCEMPSAEGAPVCARVATHIVEVKGDKWHFNLAVCDECARYAARHKPKWRIQTFEQEEKKTRTVVDAHIVP